MSAGRFTIHARRMALALACALVAGCSSVVKAPQRPALYDFGPARATLPAPNPATNPAGTAPVTTPAMTAAPLVLPDIEAGGAVEGTRVLYRLDYDNRHELRPYSQARWSAPVTQLVHERIASRLAQGRTVLSPGQLTAAPASPAASPLVLRLQLLEFAQHFDAPERSRGELRLRATLLQTGPVGDRLVAQRSFAVSRPAPSADAAGGVQALSQAVDEVAEQIGRWLQESTAG